jgi:serine/threonine protein kinase
MTEHDLVGTQVGHFRIVTLLGEGGMGSVYVGFDERLQRRVALKAVQQGRLSEEAKARFLREARVLSQLKHPHICQIHDYLEGPDRDFLVLELIEGSNLTEVIASGPDPTVKVRIARQLAEVLVATHAKGIIHRDLKPANVMLTEEGAVKVLDFGLARGEAAASTMVTARPADVGVPGPDLSAATDDSVTLDAPAGEEHTDHGVTRLGVVVGTLSHMSPEQARGEPVTTASDMYSYGLVLQELFTGRSAYVPGLSAVEQLVKARAAETVPAAGLDRDLATLISRLKDPAASVRPTALDTVEWLDRIEAKPRLRRHRALAWGAATVLAVVAVGMSVQAWRIRRQSQRIEEEATRANRETESAKAVIDFLQNDLLAQASAASQSSPNGKPDPDLKVRTALDRAAARIHGRFDQQPEVEAAIQDTIGRTYYDLGLYPEARKQLERALDLYRRVLGVENPKTATTMSRLGRIAWSQGHYPEAETLLGRALEIERRVLGPEHPDTLYSMNNLGNVYRAQGRDAQAEALYKQTLEIRRRVLGPEHPDTLTSTNNLANVYWSLGKYAQAEALYSQTLEIQRRVLGPEHPSTLLSMGNLADTYAEQGKYAQAEALFRPTCEMSRRVLGPSHPSTLDFLSDSAFMYQRQGRYGLAEAQAAQVLAARRRALGSQHPHTMQSAADLALAYVSQGRFAESEPLAREALAFNREKQPDDWQRFRAESLLGASLAGQKRYAEAEPLLLEGYQALVERKERMGWMGVASWYHVDRAREWIVQLYRAWGKPEKAAQWSKK